MSLLRRIEKGQDIAVDSQSKLSELRVRRQPAAATRDAYMDLKFFLEELFGCSVDLVLADTIKPQLRRSIMREMIHAPGL